MENEIRPRNAILFVIDSLRRDAVGAYGNAMAATPRIDEIAERGVVFDNAFIGSFPCMPARRDIWTGRYEFPWRGWGPLEEGEATLPGLLSQHGVLTQLITDHYHLWERGAGNYHHDFDGAEFIRGQENDRWMAARYDSPELDVDASKVAGHARFQDSLGRYFENTRGRSGEADYFAPRVMQRAIDWLEPAPSKEGFFLLVDCFDPHEPFDPPPEFAEMYVDDDAPLNPWPTYGTTEKYSNAELDVIRGLYAAEVTMVDKWLGMVMDRLDDLELTDRTLVIVISDHGHLFGEHGLLGKPWSGIADPNLYDELARIPLIMVDPSQHTQGERRLELVQPVDLLPTILGWFGLPLDNHTHGMDLRTLGRDNAEGREYAFFGRFGESINVTDGRWTLFCWPQDRTNQPLYWYSRLPPTFIGARAAGGLEPGPRYPARHEVPHTGRQLFDRRDDPNMTNNLIDHEPEVAKRLESAIARFLVSIDAPPEQFERLGLPAPIQETE